MCLDHMRLAVKGLMAVNSSISMHFPGMAVMLQLLGGPPSSPVMGIECAPVQQHMCVKITSHLCVKTAQGW